MTKTKECREEKKKKYICFFLLLENSRPLSPPQETQTSVPWGTPGILINLPRNWLSQNHNDISPHNGQNGHHQKVYKQEILERVWRKGNALALLVGMEIDTATMEDGMKIP